MDKYCANCEREMQLEQQDFYDSLREVSRPIIRAVWDKIVISKGDNKYTSEGLANILLCNNCFYTYFEPLTYPEQFRVN